MSRTDAHSPFRVRVARCEVSAFPVHRCAGRDARDLPNLGSEWAIGHVGRCHWQFTYTGVNICSCWMCHWHHRPEVRRAAKRAELRGVAREWNAGEQEAADSAA